VFSGTCESSWDDCLSKEIMDVYDYCPFEELGDAMSIWKSLSVTVNNVIHQDIPAALWSRTIARPKLSNLTANYLTTYYPALPTGTQFLDALRTTTVPSPYAIMSLTMHNVLCSIVLQL
ncbi:uncharacterized protein TRIREDRAFT_104695, partial [Trichoderma reesei QM6a]